VTTLDRGAIALAKDNKIHTGNAIIFSRKAIGGKSN